MQASERCIAFIRQYESFRANAYRDPGDEESGPVTIGYGSTHYEDGSKVRLGDKITKERAERMLRMDVARFAGRVSELVTATLTQNQFESYKETNDEQLHEVDKRLDAIERQMQENATTKLLADKKSTNTFKWVTLGFTAANIIVNIIFYLLNHR